MNKKTTKQKRSKKKAYKKATKKGRKKAAKKKADKMIDGIWNKNNAKFLIEIDHYKIGESEYFMSLGAIEAFLRFVKEKKYRFEIESRKIEENEFATQITVIDGKTGKTIMRVNGFCRREHDAENMPYPFETAETISYGRACKKLGFGFAVNVKAQDDPDTVKKNLAKMPTDITFLFDKLQFSVQQRADIGVMLHWNNEAIKSKLDELVDQRMKK